MEGLTQMHIIKGLSESTSLHFTSLTSFKDKISNRMFAFDLMMRPRGRYF